MRSKTPILIFSLILLSMIIIGCEQESLPPDKKGVLDWDVTSLTFFSEYKVHENGSKVKVAVGRQLSERERATFEKHETKDPGLKDLFKRAVHTDKTYLWKGCQYAVVNLTDGRPIEILVSLYGGFFAVIGQKGNYYFEGSDRDEWERTIFGRPATENKSV